MSIDWREKETLPCGLYLTIEMEDGHVFAFVSEVPDPRHCFGEDLRIVEGQFTFDGLAFNIRGELEADFLDITPHSTGRGLADLFRCSPEALRSLGGFKAIQTVVFKP